MGITNYHNYIRINYEKCLIKKPISQCDYLYIDLNHILHHVYNITKEINDTKVLKTCINKLINTYKPKKYVAIIADGVAPCAKLLTQRKRRLKGINHIKTDSGYESSYNIGLHFTPGSIFMMNLEKNLGDYIDYLKSELAKV